MGRGILMKMSLLVFLANFLSGTSSYLSACVCIKGSSYIYVSKSLKITFKDVKVGLTSRVDLKTIIIPQGISPICSSKFSYNPTLHLNIVSTVLKKFELTTTRMPLALYLFF